MEYDVWNGEEYARFSVDEGFLCDFMPLNRYLHWLKVRRGITNKKLPGVNTISVDDAYRMLEEAKHGR